MPQFKYDIFISYRHLDNQSYWIDNFHDRLRIRLTEFLGRPATIWRDKKKLEGEYFSDEIEDAIGQSRVFVSIMSPGYIDPGSDWCLRELQKFHNLATSQRFERIGNKPRIIKVVKTPAPREKYPQQLQGSNDYMFYDTDPDNDKPLFFSQEPTGPLYQKYLAKVDDVALYIRELIEEIENRPLGISPPPPDPGKTVYLAETTSDLNNERDRIMRELRDRGYRVLPEEELPRETPDYQEVVRKNLSQASLSIHLVGAKYGIIPTGEDDNDKSIVVLQNELAAECSRDSGFTRIIWIPEGLQPKGERHQKFIEHLQTDPSAQKGAELLSRPFEALKTRIIEKLTSPPPLNSAPVGEDQLTHIYLVCDKLDFNECLEKIRAIQKYLFDKGYEVTLSAPETGDQQMFQYHKDRLIDCDATLIYYGLANEFWLYSKLGEFKKAVGWGRAKPMLCKAIYRTAPETEHKRNLLTREARLLEPSYNGFTTQSLDMFIEFIEKAKTEFAKTGSEA